MKLQCMNQKTCKGRAVMGLRMFPGDYKKIKYCPFCGSKDVNLIAESPDDMEYLPEDGS